MSPKEGYWRRQFYLLSSIGVFYIIIIALFGIPLLGAFVVVLIKGAMDMRYVIIAGGCIAAGFGIWFLFRAGKRLMERIRRNAVVTGDQVRESLLLGQPMEISVLNGIVKFSCGPRSSFPPPEIAHAAPALLPESTGPKQVTDILDHLDRIDALNRSGVITPTEFELLKARLMASAEDSHTASDPQSDA